MQFLWFDGSAEIGSRLYFQANPGLIPGDDLAAAAAGISDAWGTHMPAQTGETYTLKNITITDLTTATASEGQWNGAISGLGAEAQLPTNCTTNIQAHIPLRYRGGHPVFHHPPPTQVHMSNNRQFQPAWLTGCLAAWTAFLADVAAFTHGEWSAAQPVVLRGYRNDAVPEAVTPYNITSWSVNATLGNLRRRLRSVT